jgi:hypothetical protein
MASVRTHVAAGDFGGLVGVDSLIGEPFFRVVIVVGPASGEGVGESVI